MDIILQYSASLAQSLKKGSVRFTIAARALGPSNAKDIQKKASSPSSSAFDIAQSSRTGILSATLAGEDLGKLLPRCEDEVLKTSLIDGAYEAGLCPLRCYFSHY